MRDTDFMRPYYDYLPAECVLPDELINPFWYPREKWFACEDYWGIYVSDCGRVYNSITNHILKPKPMDKAGHLGVALRLGNGYTKYVYVHRLMAKAIIPNPNNYPIVRHLNDVKDDNEIDNLAWGTQRDNHYDSVANGTYKPFSDEDREKSYAKTRKPVRVTDLKTGRIVEYRSLNDACRDLGVQQANACKVLSGSRSHTCGYFFEYLEG